MRIIFLNSWFGQIYKPFFDFIAGHSKDTDIFCLLEVDVNLHSQLGTLLPDFIGIESHKNIAIKRNFDISIFVSKRLKIEKKLLNIIKDPLLGDCLVIVFNSFVLCGVHGLPQPGNKLDSTDRLRQSKEILASVKDFVKPKIIGGDFNLMPNTESVGMFEQAGYKNFIKEFNIKNTRNKISWNQFKDEPGFVKQYFADYCFVSPDVEVKNFSVPNVEVSDHEPLILEFEI